MTYRSVFWHDDAGRLKNYSAVTKSDGASIVKIELEVRDPYRLAGILQDLAETKREQGNAKPKAAEPKPTRRTIAEQRPLLLTYREGD